MKLKNYWKRFWTLDRHASAGFTLVELIVVIAILAILAGVGIPVYSGYITKANKQADMTLVSEVKHALELGYYANTLKESGNVILYYGKAPAIDASAEEAMTAVFGSNLDSLVLKHDDWALAAVGECTWMQKTTVPEMLNEVSNLTDSVLTMLGKQATPEKLYENMFEHLDPNVLSKLCAEKGIKIDNSGASPKFAEGVTNEQLANLMVLAAAEEITNMGSDEAYAYLTGTSEAQPSTLAGMVKTFAVINGFANSDYSTQAQKDSYAALMAKLASGELNNTGDVIEELNTCFGAFFPEEAEEGVEYPIDKYFANSFDKDMSAMVDILNTVTQVSPSISGSDLNNADYYRTSESISDLFSAYANAAVSGEQCVMISYILDKSGTLHIVDSIAE